jgi:2-polyprenyl-6-hydroxyphenyl methylase/3-demethylubiquinone-9 3-methyltransferase
VSAVPSNASVDPKEVERFAALAGEWWDAAGPFAPLHRFNPVRLAWMRESLLGAFGGDPRSLAPLAGLRMLDIGCGGGLLAEPLTRLGAAVTAIDPAAESVEAARHHAATSGLSIDYRAATAEELAAAGEMFDAVIASEVVEHVADLDRFVGTVAALTRPGGIALFTTINRTLRALAFAIVGAEYVLRWLPRGTHRFDRLVRPDELAAACRGAGLLVGDRRGFVYDPVRDTWRLSERDLAINYGLAATRPGAT